MSLSIMLVDLNKFGMMTVIMNNPVLDFIYDAIYCIISDA